MNAKPPQRLFDKIAALPDDLRAEVEAFVDGLDPSPLKERRVSPVLALSEASLMRVWDNPDDDIYDTM